jgi:hypothetical protein
MHTQLRGTPCSSNSKSNPPNQRLGIPVSTLIFGRRQILQQHAIYIELCGMLDCCCPELSATSDFLFPWATAPAADRGMQETIFGPISYLRCAPTTRSKLRVLRVPEVAVQGSCCPARDSSRFSCFPGNPAHVNRSRWYLIPDWSDHRSNDGGSGGWAQRRS